MPPSVQQYFDTNVNDIKFCYYAAKLYDDSLILLHITKIEALESFQIQRYVMFRNVTLYYVVMHRVILLPVLLTQFHYAAEL
jgi:hypothetical protein